MVNNSHLLRVAKFVSSQREWVLVPRPPQILSAGRRYKAKQIAKKNVACVQTITKLWLVPEFNFVCAQAKKNGKSMQCIFKWKKKRSSFKLVSLWVWDSSPPECSMRLNIEEWCEMTSRGNKVPFSSCSLQSLAVPCADAWNRLWLRPWN